MADKQATIYIVDVGRSMGQMRHGRTETDLDYAMRYVWDRITTTVSNGRKTDLVGVVALRTDGTLFGYLYSFIFSFRLWEPFDS